MESNHLGTKATRPIIIQLLLDRELIYRNNKSQYFCSELGIFLIEILKDIWLPFLKPDFTRFTEENLEDIKENNKKMNVAIDVVKKRFLELFDDFVMNKNDIFPKINNFQIPTNDKAEYKGDNRSSIITKSMCPFCKNSSMKLITTRRDIRFLMCMNEKCQKKYLLLPKKGKIIPLITKCSLCGFDVFKIKTKKNNRFYNYNICPNCWSTGLQKEKGKNFCSHCENFQIINGKCVKRENINIL
jgi:ssDNA-binding Zn-finger/Zn-ribbon topoisomerase 1